MPRRAPRKERRDDRSAEPDRDGDLGPSFATATFGVPARDSGVVSAMVDTSQPVGRSIGTALLSTLAVSATTDFLADRIADTITQQTGLALDSELSTRRTA